MKDPLEQVEMPQIRPVYWIALFIGVGVLAAVLFPGATAIVAVILSLPVIIFLHELAHFVTAKRSGMKVTEFFVGFGPRIWSVQRDETEYGLKAIPLGGYCKIIGMTNLEDVPPEDEPRAYRSKRYGPKVLVASAGSLMHFAIALILMFGVLVFAGNYRDARATTTLQFIESGSPADEAGLREGDTLVSVDGEPLAEWEELRPRLIDRGGDTVTFTVERDGEVVDIPVTLETIENPDAADDPDAPRNLGRAGIGPDVVVPSVGVGTALVETPKQVWLLGAASVDALADRFSPSGISEYWNTLTDDGEEEDATSGSGQGSSSSEDESARFLSFVGFGRLAVQATESGWVPIMLLLISINVFVGIFNLVPLLPFDGGHIAIATYEKIMSTARRRPVRVDAAKLLPVTALVMAVLAFIFLSSLYLDISRPLDNPF
ncbi:MAG: M50 family metallopeptidase [Acidimicrobiia bacterium]